METYDWRTGTTHIEREECLRLLATEQHGVGRVAIVDDGKPMILPVNFALVGDCVVFRTAPGTKLDVARQGGTVAFEIDHVDAGTQTGWSVVVRGTSEVVTTKNQLFALRSTTLTPMLPFKDQWILIRPDEISGRRIPMAVSHL